MPDINNIGLKEFVDKKLSNETSDEKEMIGEAAPVAFNGGGGVRVHVLLQRTGSQ